MLKQSDNNSLCFICNFNLAYAILIYRKQFKQTRQLYEK